MAGRIQTSIPNAADHWLQVVGVCAEGQIFELEQLPWSGLRIICRHCGAVTSPQVQIDSSRCRGCGRTLLSMAELRSRL